MKEEREQTNQKAKWGNTTEKGDDADNSKGKSDTRPPNKKQQDKGAQQKQTTDLDAAEMLQAWETEDVSIDIDEDSSIDDLMDILNIFHNDLFDENEIETLRQVRRSERVAHKRQLGDWITLKVNGVTKQVKCNCDRCNTNGKCEFAVLFEVFQFQKVPCTKHLSVAETFEWTRKVKKAIENIVIANINV